MPDMETNLGFDAKMLATKKDFQIAVMTDAQEGIADLRNESSGNLGTKSVTFGEDEQFTPRDEASTDIPLLGRIRKKDVKMIRRGLDHEGGDDGRTFVIAADGNPQSQLLVGLEIFATVHQPDDPVCIK